MKKGQAKNIADTKKKAISKDKNIQQGPQSKSLSKKDQSSQKATSSSKNPSISKSNICSGYSSVSKDKKSKTEKNEEISVAISTGKKIRNKSPEENLNENKNLIKRRNALKSSSEIVAVNKVGKSIKKEDDIKVSDSATKNEGKSVNIISKRGRTKQIEETEKVEVNFLSKKKIFYKIIKLINSLFNLPFLQY